MREHPSALQLDSGGPEIAAHVEQCERCRQFLARERTVMPAVLEARLVKRRSWWVWAPVFAFAVAAGVFVLNDDVVRSKGAPAVAVYLKHGEVVTLWDGSKPLVPGDAVRLQVAPEGYQRVKVITRDRGELKTLYDGPVNGTTLLPLSFVADAESDWLQVVFSNGDATHSVDVRFPR